MKSETFEEKERKLDERVKSMEERVRESLNRKYDILGIEKKKSIRDKLYELDNNIFMNQFLYRKFYYDKLNHELEFALTDVIKSSRNPINKLLKFLKNLLGKKQDG